MIQHLGMKHKNIRLKPTSVVGVSGQPFAFGTAGGANDADGVPTLHRQVVLANLTRHRYPGMVHGLLFASHLE